MRVLVACEFSGTVRDAFRARGHFAMSCDLLATETPGPHHLGDVRDILAGNPIDGAPWDLMVAHPPCTYLAASGLHWNKRRPERAAQTEEALEFVRVLLTAPIPRIALENPVGCISTRIRKPDQIVQPWQFGHAESKATCLWLTGLSPLEPTNVVEPEWYRNPDGTVYRDSGGSRYSATHFRPGRGKPRPVWENQTASGQNRLPPSADRWKLRSLTYPGLARAMADQWGGVASRVAA